MHSDYLNPCFRELRDQLIESSDRDAMIALSDRAEQVLIEIKPARAYRCHELAQQLVPPDDVSADDVTMSGEAVQHDLRRLIEDLTDAADLRADEVGQPVHTVDELSKMFSVSKKTISRWREQGLVARRMMFEDRKRVGFLRSSVQRFVAANPQRVRRGQKFRQMSPGERESMIELARRLAANRLPRTEAIKQIARQMNRSVETVRYTLKQFEQDHDDAALFEDDANQLSDELKQEIYRQYRRGTPVAALADRFGRATTTIYRIINQLRAERVFDLPLDFVYNKEFDKAKAEQEILASMPENKRAPRKQRVPKDLPAYLASLYEVPLLSREQESHLFRKFNYLKYRAAKLREKLDAARPSTRLLDKVERFYDEAVRTKNQIIRANLRLVVSIARQRSSPLQDLFELISDGNISLIRAVEKFDYGRGFKFSTYATWALIKNFARTVPAELKHATRYRTSQDELLAAERDSRGDLRRQETAQQSRERQVDKILSRLNEREQRIIIRRYGLDYEHEPKTLKQLGAELGVTKERVRQLEARALGKLRDAAVQEKIELPE